MKTKILVTLMVATLISVAAWKSQGQPNETAKISYEYKVLNDPTETETIDGGVMKLNLMKSSEVVRERGSCPGPSN